MGSQGFKPDYDALKQGLQDAVEKKDSKYPEAELRAAMEKFQVAMQDMEKIRQAESAKKSEAYLTENGKKQGVTTTASGLQYEVLKAAEGPKPAATDTVKVHYKGTLVNGDEFDSSYSRKQARRVPPQWRDPRLDRRGAAHEQGQQVQVRHPRQAGLRRAGQPTQDRPRSADVGL